MPWNQPDPHKPPGGRRQDAAGADVYAKAYESVLGKEGEVVVLSPDGEFSSYFKSPGQSQGPSP